jgi:hypothetical protein
MLRTAHTFGTRSFSRKAWLAASALVLACGAAQGGVVSFVTYQGELSTAGVPVTGVYDLEFRVFDVLSGGSQLGSTLCVDNVSIVSGRFTVQLDSTSIASLSTRFLQVGVRADSGTACGSGPAFTTLLPRQEVTSAPRAFFALEAGSALAANNATRLGGQFASFYTNAANLSSGTIPAARYGTTVVQTSTNNTLTGVNVLDNPNNVFFGVGSNLSGLWRLGGNAGTNPALDFVGTTNNVGFTIRANNQPAIRITPFGADTHTIVMGSPSNSAGLFVGATISGGGSDFPLDERNQITGDFGTIAGGLGHVVARSGFVGGGFQNRTGNWSTASGGSGNWAFGLYSTVGGGQNNRIESPDADPAPNGGTIAGGQNNTVNATTATIGGGSGNEIDQNGFNAVIAGGSFNSAVGVGSAVLGGSSNVAGGDFSVVMGNAARTRTPAQAGDADGDEGSFVFADQSVGTSLTTTGPNQFLIRAAGGVGIGLSNPSSQLHVQGNATSVVRAENATTLSSAAAVLGAITSTSPGGFSAGVRGTNAGLAGSGVGVFGSHAGGGFGVYGIAQGTNGIGLYGVANSTGGYGVFGTSSASNGVGLYGSAGGASAWAGFFAGRVNVTGAFSAASKAFRIDHPLDPANKELWHSCVESPDMMTIYNGVTTTDERGYATVSLPAYFEALNTDYRYQLTVIDEADSEEWTLAKVARPVQGNAFVIRTSSPSTKVSWQVTGIRNDAFARSNRIVPEQDKEVKGTYLNPQAFGLPLSMSAPGINAQASHDLAQ